MSSSNCCFLIWISQEAGEVVWYSHLLKNCPLFVVIHTKAFSWSMKQKWIFFWNSLVFFYDQTDFCNLISGSSACSKSSLNIWNFLVHKLLKPSLENFEHYFASVWVEYNCELVWTFFGIDFLWDWNENWPFWIPWPFLSFPNLLAHWVQHFDNFIF